MNIIYITICNNTTKFHASFYCFLYHEKNNLYKLFFLKNSFSDLQCVAYLMIMNWLIYGCRQIADIISVYKTASSFCSCNSSIAISFSSGDTTSFLHTIFHTIHKKCTINKKIMAIANTKKTCKNVIINCKSVVGTNVTLNVLNLLYRHIIKFNFKV